MRFSFPLQALLNWKQKLEEFSQIRLSQKVHRLKEQEERIDHLRSRRRAYARELQEKSSQGIPADEYVLYKEFAQISHDLLKAEEKRREDLSQEVVEERQNLIRLSREKKLLERLREKRFKIFSDQEEKSEQKKNDEIVIAKHRPPQAR